jgi:hypothetical protein
MCGLRGLRGRIGLGAGVLPVLFLVAECALVGCVGDDTLANGSPAVQGGSGPTPYDATVDGQGELDDAADEANDAALAGEGGSDAADASAGDSAIAAAGDAAIDSGSVDAGDSAAADATDATTTDGSGNDAGDASDGG